MHCYHSRLTWGNVANEMETQGCLLHSLFEGQKGFMKGEDIEYLRMHKNLSSRK